MVFVLHDADGPGSVIYEALYNALEPLGIEVVNLGLDPAEARDMGLTAEPVKRKKNNRVPVAEYIPEDDQEWLQKNRIELNAMTTPQFVDWLTAKVSSYFRTKRLSPKVVPPAEVLVERLEQEARAAIERRIVEEVMKAANIPERVATEFAEVEPWVTAAAKELVRSLPNRLKTTPTAHWTDIVKEKGTVISSPPSRKNRSKMQSREQAAE